MKLKINTLISLAVVVLIALCCIQVYLVKSTYNFKVAEFRLEVKDRLSKISNDYSDIDSTIVHKKDLLYKQLAENYFADPKFENQIKNRLLQNDFKGYFTLKLQQEIDKEFPEQSIDFAIVLNKFVIYDKVKKADTIFAEKPYIENKMYGDLVTLEDAFLIRNYVGTASLATSTDNYNLLTEDSLYVSIKNWQFIILKRMSLLLFFAFVSILTLIAIFVFTIKSLIKQKKLSDIKTDFINNITHELKTPLSTLAVSTKILERKEIRENEVVYNELVNTINRQHDRLQNIIDQVLNNSLGYEEIELHKENINAYSFLNNIIEDFKITQPGINIISNLTTEATLNLDKFHLTTAIVNVLENAVKYGSKTIYITTSLDANEFQISIEDNGIGIEKNKQSLLFDKFYRVNHGNLHNTKGLGLGLYYVDQIIKAHQGTIKLISDLGSGTKFILSIPS